MAYACDYCGKTFDIGHNVSHAKNRVSRMRRPNLHSKRVVEAGGIVRRLLCTKCARTAVRPQDLKLEVKE
jgi:ribosomal protein L28